MNAYRVAQFAEMTGITVRTLHHYDRIGLLKPSDVTESGHRLYGSVDLLRLQQILTLKWMGFSLREIKDVLGSPTYDLRQSLEIQKAAIDAQIKRLREASDALEQALDLAAEIGGEDELDIDTIHAIIRAVTVNEHNELMQRYYSDDARQRLKARQFAFTQADIEAGTRAWSELYAAFEKHAHEAPDSPAVQALAAKMHELVEIFTGGDPEILEGLKRAVSHRDQLPDYYFPYPESLQRFMQQAYMIYQERQK